MTRLWLDIRTHQAAAALLLAYWLMTLAVAFATWNRGIPAPVLALLFTTPLIAGSLVGRWRAITSEPASRTADRIQGAMMAGVLSAELSFLVMRGGALDEVIGWTRGRHFQGGEVLEFAVGFALVGLLLGLVGAAFGVVLDRLRQRGKIPSA